MGDPLAAFTFLDDMVPPATAPGNGKAPGWQEPLIEDVPEGGRNAALTALAGRWLGKGLSAAETTVQALGVNARWKSPLPEGEVRGIVASVGATHARNHPADKIPLPEHANPELKPYPLTSLEQIYNAPPVEWLIEDILFDRSLSLLGAYAGRGKSILSLAMARSVATGRPLFGKTVKRTGPVLIVDEENSHSDIRNRLMESMKVKTNCPIHFLSFAGILIDDDASFARLRLTIAEVKPVLLILDSLVRLHLAEENKSSEMAPVMRRLRQLANDGTSVLCQHHHGKGEGNMESRARGSSDIVAGVDVEYALTKDGSDLALCTVKSRRQAIAPMRLRIGLVGDELITYLGERENPERAIREAILERLREAPAGKEEILAYVKNKGLRIGKNSLPDVLEPMTGHEIRVRAGAHGKYLYEIQ